MQCEITTGTSDTEREFYWCTTHKLFAKTIDSGCAKSPKEEVIDLSKVVVPEEVPVTDKPGGKVIGTAKLVKMRGSVMAEVTITDREYDVIGKGCSIGYSVAE